MHSLDGSLLAHLHSHGPSSPRVLSFHLHRSGAHVRGRLSVLESMGLVRRLERGLYGVDEKRYGRLLREREFRQGLRLGLERFEPWERARMGWELGSLNPRSPAYGRGYRR